MYQFQYGTLMINQPNNANAPAIATRFPKPNAPRANTQATTIAASVSVTNCLTRFGTMVAVAGLPLGTCTTKAYGLDLYLSMKAVRAASSLHCSGDMPGNM